MGKKYMFFQLLSTIKVNLVAKIMHANTLGKKVVKIGQKFEWERDRHKHFWSSWGYNFLSFKGMTLKLIQATILDSRKILE